MTEQRKESQALTAKIALLGDEARYLNKQVQKIKKEILDLKNKRDNINSAVKEEQLDLFGEKL